MTAGASSAASTLLFEPAEQFSATVDLSRYAVMKPRAEPRRQPGVLFQHHLAPLNLPIPIRFGRFSAVNFELCYEKLSPVKTTLIEITGFFQMEVDPNKKHPGGRPRGSTNANVTRRRINLRRAQYAVQREIDPTIKLNSLAILEQVMRHFYHKAQNSREYGFRG
jgi:hypothetical protein